VDTFSFRLHGRIPHLFSNMHHDDPSDNGSRTENSKNKYLLKEDFGTSMNELHVLEYQATIVISIDNGVRNDCTISQARPKR
jgi:hypothetical protein